MEVEEFIRNIYAIIKEKEKIHKLLADLDRKLQVEGPGITYRPPGFIDINYYDHLYVLGDLHGDFDTLIEFIIKEKILEKLENSDKGVIVIFLGDYVDRGPQQIEVLIAVSLLKTLYVENIILLRGNHEASPLIIPYPHDFPEVLRAYYGYSYLVIYREIFRLFQKLPYGARLRNQILFLHGGPPVRVLKSKSFEEAFSIGLPVVDDLVLEEILWNDPIDDKSITHSPSFRGAGVLFGEEVTLATLRLARTKYIVRGHEPAEGYKANHEGRVLTLFDSRIPNYGISRAGYLSISSGDDLDDITKYVKILE